MACKGYEGGVPSRRAGEASAPSGGQQLLSAEPAVGWCLPRHVSWWGQLTPGVVGVPRAGDGGAGRVRGCDACVRVTRRRMGCLDSPVVCVGVRFQAANTWCVPPPLIKVRL